MGDAVRSCGLSAPGLFHAADDLHDEDANDAFYPNSTYFAGRLARRLGDGFNFSYQAGFRAAQPSALAFRRSSLDQRLAFTYNADGWNLTANFLNGIFFGGTTTFPNWMNLDVTATKAFGKLQVGAVAFASTDISTPNPNYRRQGQIAAGGFVGYNFGSFILQTYVTRDVAKRGYAGYDTRGWTRLIVPLYTYKEAPAPEPIRSRY